jgi:hypothetical protein
MRPYADLLKNGSRDVTHPAPAAEAEIVTRAGCDLGRDGLPASDGDGDAVLDGDAERVRDCHPEGITSLGEFSGSGPQDARRSALRMFGIVRSSALLARSLA